MPSFSDFQIYKCFNIKFISFFEYPPKYKKNIKQVKNKPAERNILVGRTIKYRIKTIIAVIILTLYALGIDPGASIELMKYEFGRVAAAGQLNLAKSGKE